jgi:DNA-binding response OmpR family regulator
VRLLVVEDSPRLNAALVAGLRATGRVVDSAADGKEALNFLAANLYEVVVLDLALPRVDGVAVLRQMRRDDRRCRVLILSARDQVSDRIDALNLGADDYLVKPFDFGELNARVTALGRRQYGETLTALTIGLLTVDITARIARVAARPLPLSPKEFGLLELLVRNRGRWLSRAMVFKHLYDSTSDSSEHVVEVLLSTLRAKLRQAGIESLVETRRGYGYSIA